MSHQSDIFDAIVNDSAILAIVDGRVFADVAIGTTAPPYLVYQIIGTTSTTSHDGKRDLEFPILQVSCWATGKASAIALARAVDNAIGGKTLPGASAATCIFTGQSGTYETDTKLFGEILEYQTASTITN